MKYSMYSIIDATLKHSSAQAFYACSCIFIGIFLINADVIDSKIGLICFITLFYAMFNHSITCLCKHEDLGNYARGHYILQIMLFTIISFLLVISWFTSILYIFISMCFYNVTILLHHVGIALFIECIMLITLTTGWIIIMFILKIKDDTDKNSSIKKKSNDGQEIKYNKTINIDIRQ